MSAKLRNYAVKAVGDILPLDHDTLEEMVNYTLTLPIADIEAHLLGLLGQSDDSVVFIENFLEMKRQEDEQNEKKSGKKEDGKKEKEPVWGASQPQPQPRKNRLSGNKSSATVSELANLKPSNQLTGTQAKKSKKKNLDSLKDIEAALNELEVERAQAEPEHAKRVCNCMATKHPLFEVAPNCLNCGKIICSKEGLQPCSFCGRELLSQAEKAEIVNILQSEKDLIGVKQANPTNKEIQKATRTPGKKIKYASAPGQNLWKAQDEALRLVEERAKKHRQEEAESELHRVEIEEQQKELEHFSRAKQTNPDLIKAQDRLDTLLHFQATGAERSKIIDNASDFEMPGTSSGSMWLSPVEKALQLKKQQKQMRKMETAEKARTGRTKKVLEMVIKDGKVKMVEKHVADTEPAQEKQDIDELEDQLRSEKLSSEAAMAKNTWNYEREQDKWDKPVYVAKQPASKSTPQYVGHGNRVQQNQGDNAELVVTMI